MSASRRSSTALLPALLLALFACDAAPTAPAPPPSSEVPLSASDLAPAAPEPAPARAYRADRSVVRSASACQEWRLRHPPTNIVCPDGLEDGEIITFEPNGTCMRRGPREGLVPCPSVTPLPPRAATSAGQAPGVPELPGSPGPERPFPPKGSELPLTNP